MKQDIIVSSFYITAKGFTKCILKTRLPDISLQTLPNLIKQTTISMNLNCHGFFYLSLVAYEKKKFFKVLTNYHFKL